MAFINSVYQLLVLNIYKSDGLLTIYSGFGANIGSVIIGDLTTFAASMVIFE